MKNMLFSRRSWPVWAAAGFSLLASVILAVTHPDQSIISFDEGFHGGAVLFFHEMIAFYLHGRQGVRPTYLLGEFANGVTLYPPLWSGVATVFSFLFGVSTDVFRTATSFFYFLSLMTVFFFIRTAARSDRAAALSMAVLATVPMVMIYSHLMMLEVPLLWGITAMLAAVYLTAFELLPRRWPVVLGMAALFFLAPLSKLPAIGITWAAAFGFAFLASLFFPRQKTYKRFLKPELLLYLACSFLGLFVFLRAEVHFLHTNMIDFFLQQSQGSASGSSIQHAWDMLRANYLFYLRDFRHMPYLAWLWFGSPVVLLLWKRTPLSLFLIVWGAVVYAAFTAVNPQVPQYLMPIYAPMAIGVGLLFNEVGSLADRIWKSRKTAVPFGTAVAGLLTAVMMIGQVRAMPNSEGYQWRAVPTGQEEAAARLAAMAGYGDRVMSWHDGDTYAVRIAALSKVPQIMNADHQVCTSAMEQNFEWALEVHQPPYLSDIDRQELSSSGWQLVDRYGSNGATKLYHQGKSIWPFAVEGESYGPQRAIADPAASGGLALPLHASESQPAIWGCYRLFPFGNLSVDYTLRPLAVPASLPNRQVVAVLQYAAYPGGEGGQREVTAGELRSTAAYQTFSFAVRHQRVDLPGELKVTLTAPVDLLLDKIIVRPAS